MKTMARESSRELGVKVLAGQKRLATLASGRVGFPTRPGYSSETERACPGIFAPSMGTDSVVGERGRSQQEWSMRGV